MIVTIEVLAMVRDLKPYDDEMVDPEASHRRGFQHGAVTLLRLIAPRLDPAEARQLAAWAGADLRDWRIVGHEAADSASPPSPPPISN
jgi:hypothetical protein